MYYVKRHEEGIYIKEENKTIIKNTSLIKYVDQLCLKHMATYDGRVDAVKKKLGIKTNIPIYINNELILYPIKSIRCYNTVLVNYFQVLSIILVDKQHTRFIFTNLEEEIFHVNYRKIMKQHSQIEIIIKYLNNQVSL